MSIPILRGRPFIDAERPPRVAAFPALISSRAAREVWPGRDALGQQFRRADSSQKIPFEVVGIVGDGHMTQLDAASPLMVYVPYWMRNDPRATLVVRTSATPTLAAASIRRAVWDVDPELAIGEPRALVSLVEASRAPRRYQVTLFVAFGIAALLIAIVGVYGVTAYGVSRRRREMNLRVALGAQVSQVMRLVVQQTTIPVAVGMAAGAAGAVALGGILGSQLFEVRARDPLIIGAIVALVGTVGIATCVLAARQGLVIEPASALREE
jgi:hypothetical protein